MNITSLLTVGYMLYRTNLKISELMTADSGIFQCLASNSAGNTHSSAFLNVVKEQLTTNQEQESNMLINYSLMLC